MGGVSTVRTELTQWVECEDDIVAVNVPGVQYAQLRADRQIDGGRNGHRCVLRRVHIVVDERHEEERAATSSGHSIVRHNHFHHVPVRLIHIVEKLSFNNTQMLEN